MSGYTPVFSSIFTGTLHGRWPDTGVWVCLLALADWRGHIDMTPEYVASVTGMPLADLEACIARFMQADPRSRSQVEDGRRLALIDPARPWGWRIVNFQKYRERARDSQRVADGRNAEKLRKWREGKRNPVKPADTRSNPNDPNSDSDSDTDTDTDSDSEKVPTEPVAPKRDVVAEVFEHWKVSHNHPQARLDDKRRRLIRAALANYTAEQLCEAISGYHNSPHHMGENDRATRYDAIELFLRDAKHIDAGLQFAREPPSSFSKTTRKNLSNTAGWAPPEVRNAAR